MLRLLVLAQILFSSEFLCNSEINFKNSEDELVSVAVIFRHGDRTPVDPYPTDPYRNASYWPVGFGQLTNKGKMRHFQLGQWFRNRYKNFLPDQYSEKDIYVRATDVDRTLMSAASNLAGLYPPQGKQVWNPDLIWQPIPIHTIPEKQDYLLAMKKPCEKYDFLMKKLLKSPEFLDIRKRNHDLYAYLSRYSGAAVTDLLGLEFIYNTLTIETSYNFSLPNWTVPVFPDKLRPWAQFCFAVACYTPELARLKTGPLFDEILNHFLNATQQKTGRKFFMYSGHDTTIANVLNTLNVFQYHSPPYAATILLELRSRNGSFYVNMLYKNTSTPQEITLKDCQFNCPLEQFTKILEPIRLDHEQWQKECKIKFLGILPYTTLESSVFIGCMGLLFLLLSSFVISIICFKMRNEKQDYLRLPNEDV